MTTMGARGRSTLARLVTLLLVAVLVAGCSSGGGDDDPEPTLEPTVELTPTIEPTPAMSMGDVQWAIELDDTGAPVDSITQVSRSVEVIYAVAELRAVQPGTEYTAVWTINGQAIDGKSETVEVEEGAASGWISFSLTWTGETLWPVGALGVTITADSGESITGTVQIVS
jgi:hypothetical protein